jgi:hypothetical protein
VINETRLDDTVTEDVSDDKNPEAVTEEKQ